MSASAGGPAEGNASYGHKEFKRSKSHFADRVTADGLDGWPVEAGRYRLVVSRACPWAGRALVARRLLGLESALSLGITDPIQDDRSWRFTLDPGGRDPVLGIRFLSEAYDARESGYPGGVSVPALVDVPSGKLVTNDYQRITLDFTTEWTALHREGAPDLYPEPLRDEIDGVMGIYLASGWRAGAISSATPSRRRTSGCSARWCGSTRCTTATSSATAGSWPRTVQTPGRGVKRQVHAGDRFGGWLEERSATAHRRGGRRRP